MSEEKKSKFECVSKINNSIYAVNSSDRENFSYLLNMVYEFPKGEEVMNDVAFKGYRFMYMAMMGMNGSCDFDGKSIYLNAFDMQKNLAPILVHESQHIRQTEMLKELTGVEKIGDYINGLNTKDFIKLNRAVEADACAHQAAYAYQMKDTYPDVFNKEMKTPMTQAYASEMDKSGDEKKAMQASFQAWYGYKNYQESYEQRYVMQLNSRTAKEEKDNVCLSDRTVSNKVLSAVCLHNGQSYMTESFFDRPENVAVSKKTKEALVATTDNTVSSLPVREELKTSNVQLNAIIANKLSVRGK